MDANGDTAGADTITALQSSVGRDRYPVAGSSRPGDKHSLPIFRSRHRHRPVPVFTWTGIYIGINGGYGFGDSNWTAPGLGSTGNFNTDGFLIGGTLGGNYQWGQFVFGIEADGDWQNLSGNTACGSGFSYTCTTQSEWLATVRGRAGYAWDRVLFYGTGGAAFGNVQTGSTGSFDSSTQIGWTGGGGVEFAFTPNLTAKVEYLYVDLGNASCNINCATSTSVSFTESLVRGGINYKFW
jgi:outer membrane immunogenic protein